MRVSAVTGNIDPSSASGFAENSVGHRFMTAGNAVSTIGTLAEGETKTTPLANVRGAVQSDSVRVEAVGFSGFPDGIFVRGKVSAAETLTISYTNMTNAPVGVPAHDIALLVTR